MGTNALVEIADYYPHELKRRYGGIAPVHKEIENILSQGTNRYRTLLNKFTQYMEQFLEIQKNPDPQRALEPSWINGFFPSMDGIAVFGFISYKKPRMIIEIGSGYSTKFAARAIKLNSPSTKLISIDPYPRAEIDQLCDEIIRKPLEECELDLFDELSNDDILFFDGSHRVLQNSDNTVLFMEVIPRLSPGVYIHLHDICWPFDYPDEWGKRMYSEQYVLGAMLLYAHDIFDIILPNSYISFCTDLINLFNPLWNAPHLEGIDRHGVSFWMSKKEPSKLSYAKKMFNLFKA